MTTILIILLILILIGAIPGWHGYGYAPSGILGVILIVLLILMLTEQV